MSEGEFDDPQEEDERDGDEDGDGDAHPYAQGVNEVFGAIANLIQKEKLVEALSRWMESIPEGARKEERLRKHTAYVNMFFGLGIFSGICFLGYVKVLPSDATTGLLGALIGYWYGNQRSR